MGRGEAWGLQSPYSELKAPREGAVLHLGVEGQTAPRPQQTPGPQQAGGDWQRDPGRAPAHFKAKPGTWGSRVGVRTDDPPEAGSPAHKPRRSREPRPLRSSIPDAIRTNPKGC